MKSTADIILKNNQRINLAYKKTVVIKKKYFVIFIILSLIFLNIYNPSFAQAPTIENQENNQKISLEEERKILENQLKELEAQINEYEKTIEKYKTQKKTLQNEINRLQAQINQINLKIKALNLTLNQLDTEIKITQRKIDDTQYKINKKKESLTTLIRKLYEFDSLSTIEILVANETISEFFNNINNLLLLQNQIKNTLDEIMALRDQLIEEKQTLALKYEDVENLKLYQINQQKKVENIRKEKDNLLKITKGKESEYQKLLQKTKETAAEIRKRIFKLLGGGELTFEEAYKYAKLAEQATGVRASFILAILDRESLFGKNVGQCSYKTAMHPTRDLPYFLELMKKLNMDPEFVKVSCPIKIHGAYGGAMGPAQFIPSTWKIYEKAIASITGNNPPNPWNNGDAFVAAALYLKDLLNSKSCQAYASANKNSLPYQELLERCAAAQYYAGSNWYTYRLWYGEPVVSKANQFEKDISLLTSS